VPAAIWCCYDVFRTKNLGAMYHRDNMTISVDWLALAW